MGRPAFAVVPVEVFGDARLGARDLRVLCVLYAHANEEGVCWPSRVCLAEMTGIDQRHVKRSLIRLQEFGWLVVVPGAGRGRLTQYALTVAVEKGDDSAPFCDGETGADLATFCSEERGAGSAPVSDLKGGRFGSKRGPIRAEKGAGSGHVEHTRNKPGTEKQTPPRACAHGEGGSESAVDGSPSPPAPPIPVRSTTKAPTPVELPPWLPQESWAEFLEHRRKLKAPMTDTAQRRAIAELGRLREAGHDADAVLGQSIVNGWKGLFPLKGREGVHAFERSRMDGTIHALHSIFGDQGHGDNDVSEGHGVSGGRVRGGTDAGTRGGLLGPTGRNA